MSFLLKNQLFWYLKLSNFINPFITRDFFCFYIDFSCQKNWTSQKLELKKFFHCDIHEKHFFWEFHTCLLGIFHCRMLLTTWFWCLNFKMFHILFLDVKEDIKIIFGWIWRYSMGCFKTTNCWLYLWWTFRTFWRWKPSRNLFWSILLWRSSCQYQIPASSFKFIHIWYNLETLKLIHFNY